MGGSSSTALPPPPPPPPSPPPPPREELRLPPPRTRTTRREALRLPPPTRSKQPVLTHRLHWHPTFDAHATARRKMRQHLASPSTTMPRTRPINASKMTPFEKYKARIRAQPKRHKLRLRRHNRVPVKRRQQVRRLPKNLAYLRQKALKKEQSAVAAVYLPKLTEHDECPICFSKFTPDPTAETLSQQLGLVKTCHPKAEKGGGHVFHADCITEWLQQSKTCPICRKLCYPRKKKKRTQQLPKTAVRGRDFARLKARLDYARRQRRLTKDYPQQRVNVRPHHRQNGRGRLFAAADQRRRPERSL